MHVFLTVVMFLRKKISIYLFIMKNTYTFGKN